MSVSPAPDLHHDQPAMRIVASAEDAVERLDALYDAATTALRGSLDRLPGAWRAADSAEERRAFRYPELVAHL